MKVTRTKPCTDCVNEGLSERTDPRPLVLEGDTWRCGAGHEARVSGAEFMRMRGATPLFDDDPRDPDTEYDRARDNRGGMFST